MKFSYIGRTKHQKSISCILSVDTHTCTHVRVDEMKTQTIRKSVCVREMHLHTTFTSTDPVLCMRTYTMHFSGACN